MNSQIKLNNSQEWLLHEILSEKARREFAQLKQDFDFLEDGCEKLSLLEFYQNYHVQIEQKQKYPAFLEILELLNIFWKKP